MTINTFWKIILKSIGLWLLLNCFYILPQFFSTLTFIEKKLDWSNLLIIWVGNIILLLIFILIIRVFLFKTSWLITVLKLDKQFIEERIELNIGQSQVLSIIVILIGGFVFIESLPFFIQHILRFSQQKIAFKDYSDTPWIIYSFIKTIIGYLTLTNSAFIVKLINKRNSNSSPNEQ